MFVCKASLLKLDTCLLRQMTYSFTRGVKYEYTFRNMHPITLLSQRLQFSNMYSSRQPTTFHILVIYPIKLEAFLI